MTRAKKNLIYPAVPVLSTVILIAMYWHSLPVELPSHFDADGNASGTMARSLLLLYPLVGIVLAIIPHGLSLIFKKLRSRTLFLSSAFLALIAFCSAGVACTSGRVPVFMYLEPVCLLLALVFLFVTCRS